MTEDRRRDLTISNPRPVLAPVMRIIVLAFEDILASYGSDVILRDVNVVDVVGF